MSRFTSLLFCALAGVVLALPASADDPPKNLTPQEQKALFAKWYKLMLTGREAYQKADYSNAVKTFREALEIARTLYPKSEFPNGHDNLATNLNDLASLFHDLGKFAEAEPLYKESLEIKRQLFKGDHREVATVLNNLAMFYKDQGKFAKAEPLYKESLEMTKRLFKGDHISIAFNMNNLAILYQEQGKFAEAEPLSRGSLDMFRRLFKGDHPNVATSLDNLALLYKEQGKFTDAEPLFKDALGMTKRFFKGDHPSIATSLNNLAMLYQAQGKFIEAEGLFKNSLEMLKRLFKGDHPSIATSLNNLAILYSDHGKFAEAETLFKNALDMRKRLFKGNDPAKAQILNNLAAINLARRQYPEAEERYKDALEIFKNAFKGDHPNIVAGTSNLAFLYLIQGKLADAEVRYEDALAMSKRLFKGDHRDVAQSLNDLAMVYRDRGKYSQAKLLSKDGLAMQKRLFKGDHRDLAVSLIRLAVLYRDEGNDAQAQVAASEALAMSRRLTTTLASQKAIGEVLTWIASQPAYWSLYLSIAWKRQDDPGTVYPEVWANKGAVSRVYEGLLQRVRTTGTNLQTETIFAELVDARRRHAELLLAPPTQDPATQKKRERDIQFYEDRIQTRTQALRPLLPAIERAKKLAAASPKDLQKVLPPDTALIDFIRFAYIEHDKDKPGKAGENRTIRYLAFVVTRDKITWVDLATAEEIDKAVKSWREAITQRKKVPNEIPAKVRELVWDKISKELPDSIKTLYICPDAALCGVPWVALPGDKPDTILLEQYAIATIPHATFLLDKLWPQEPARNSRTSVMAVGGVKYNAELAPAAPRRADSEPLVKPNALVDWAPLDHTRGEAERFAKIARDKKLSATTFTDEKATAEAVLTSLPNVRYAHLATHGFFADPSFRFVYNLNEKDYEIQFGERIGKAVNSPLVMSGLVFAGANKPKTPAYGILTGEALIDLDLSGLELAVLSACETGLGDVADGEGTFSLQRAFHMAGTRNVVASLWKVPDQSTAALMGRFYHYLWMKNLSAMESLRQAQLDIYRNPDKITEWAKDFGGSAPEDESEAKPATGGKSHPKKWAAFVLSGPGR